VVDSAQGQVRSLAERLRDADDREIAALLAARGVSAGASWHDWFDAADALLSPDSVAAAVAALPRDALCDLADGTGPSRLGLTDADGAPYPQACAAVTAPQTRTPDSTPRPASDDAAAHAAERAFTSMSIMADLLVECLRTPLARVGDRLAAGERRRLAADDVVRDGDTADLVASAAASAGLLRGDDRRWLVTSAGSEWVSAATTDRWARLVEGLRDAMPDALRTREGGWIDPALWSGAYPLSAAWPDEAARWSALWELAGLSADGGETPWAVALREGRSADPTALAALLPGEVDRVFLQNDLTAISPGTLAPPLDMRLRSMAVRESHAQASTYRFTEATLSASLSAGETEASIRSFLEALSLTGVPQPLAYLLERTAARHGLVRVGIDPGSGHTVVESADAHILETIAVDQALRPLGLISDGDRLRSRADHRAVYWALSDARYPVIAVDESGTTLALGRDRLAPESEPAADRYAALIARLRESEQGDAAGAWLERELAAAVKTKATLVVSVAMPDGSTRDLTLEATGLGGGRLRGLDRGADVERTLPIRSITAARRA